MTLNEIRFFGDINENNFWPFENRKESPKCDYTAGTEVHNDRRACYMNILSLALNYYLIVEIATDDNN